MRGTASTVRGKAVLGGVAVSPVMRMPRPADAEPGRLRAGLAGGHRSLGFTVIAGLACCQAASAHAPVIWAAGGSRSRLCWVAAAGWLSGVAPQ